MRRGRDHAGLDGGRGSAALRARGIPLPGADRAAGPAAGRRQCQPFGTDQPDLGAPCARRSWGRSVTDRRAGAGRDRRRSTVAQVRRDGIDILRAGVITPPTRSRPPPGLNPRRWRAPAPPARAGQGGRCFHPACWDRIMRRACFAGLRRAMSPRAGALITPPGRSCRDRHWRRGSLILGPSGDLAEAARPVWYFACGRCHRGRDDR